MKIIAIESTIVATMSLPLAPLREIVTRKREMRDPSQGLEKETTIIIADTKMIAVIGEIGVTRGTSREGEEKRREGSKREEDSSRQTGTRGVCMRGRRMITKLIKENSNYLLKNLLAETDNIQLATQRGMLRLLPKKGQ
jgi:hypothetical protein